MSGRIGSAVPKHVNKTIYLKACFDHSEWQHADTSHSSGSCSQQNSLASIGRPVEEKVLLQGVEGAEVDAHPWDAAHKWLPERKEYNKHVLYSVFLFLWCHYWWLDFTECQLNFDEWLHFTDMHCLNFMIVSHLFCFSCIKYCLTI